MLYSAPQQTYLLAVADANGPYSPRHGRCANFALNYGLVDTVVKLNDGRKGLWSSFAPEDAAQTGIADFYGQVLTAKGRDVVQLILATPSPQEPT